MVDGFVTSSRPLTGPKSPVLYGQSFSGTPVMAPSGPFGDDYVKRFNPSQTTHSFRTGRAADPQFADGSSMEDIVDGSSSQAGFFSQLKEDYRQRPSTAADLGHEFWTKSYRVSFSRTGLTSGQGTTYGQYYDGPCIPDAVLQSGYTWWLEPDPFDMGYYGPKAIKLAIPTHPVEGLAVALAELHSEGFPHGITPTDLAAGTNRARLAGDKYLETQFGWLPLYGDVRKTLYAVKHAGELLRQYERNSGRPVRRKVYFDPTSTISTNTIGSGLVTLPNFSSINTSSMFKAGRTGQFTETTRKQSRVWFSGAFTYLLQTSDGRLGLLKSYEEKANHLLGLRLTPEVLWNLTPWSWLSDWKLSVGDNISNATALTSDGLVLTYGYMMRETIIDHTYTVAGPVLLNGNAGPWEITFTTVMKERFRASPFGFGINPASFTDRQWSILGALGLTLAPKKLFP